MGLIERLVNWYSRRVWGEASEGIRLDFQSAQYLDSCAEARDAPSAFRHLAKLLPDGCNLCLESGSVAREVQEFLAEHAAADPPLLKPCMICPKPKLYHIAATAENLAKLACFAEGYTLPELCFHVYAYKDEAVLVNWHDFPDPDCLMLSPELPDERVRSFASALGCTVRRAPEPQ